MKRWVNKRLVWGLLAACIGVMLTAGPSFGQPKPDRSPLPVEFPAGLVRDLSPALHCPGIYLPDGVEGSSGFDMVHYRIEIRIDPATEWVGGTVRARFRVAAGALDSVYLHLKNNMAISDVRLEEMPVLYLHSADSIRVGLGGPPALGETLQVEVDYGGFTGSQGLRFYEEAIYNLSEPDLARNWFPCYDEPWDKATSEMIVTVPDTMYCASNGLLLSDTDNLDGTRTFHWRTNYRHSTYLISVAISNYVSFSHWFHYTDTDSMEMPYYVYPRKYAAAQLSFSNTPLMMEFFSNRFGLYPFIEEKYGTAMAPLGGAMENLTCTTFGSGLVYGTHDKDWVVAHELAHSWFGNSVTMSDWKDIWLNEGFATYSDALWAEQADGPAGLKARMDQFRNDYFNEDALNRYPIYDPLYMWSATVYRKGAWVLHMLRCLMGGPEFFTAMQTYYASYAFQTATTADFKAVCETVSGLDLTEFFDQWIYQAGYPEYEYGWEQFYTGSDHQLDLTVNQIQMDAPVFTIPIEIRVVTITGDSILELPVHSPSEVYHFGFSSVPLEVQLDPNGKVLHKSTSTATGVVTPRLEPRLTSMAVPVPSSGPVRIDFMLPVPGDVVLEIFDAAGRRQGTVRRMDLQASRHSIELRSGREGVELSRSGVYFYRLSSGAAITTGKFMLIR